MTPFVDDALNKEPFRSFLSTWKSVRKNDGLPTRQDIHLRDFVNHLENLIIYERRGPRDLRYRLTGSGVSERVQNVGIEINLFDLFVPDIRKSCEVWWNTIMDRPCGGIIEFSTAFTDGTTRAGMAIALPLLSQRGEPLLLSLNHMMGILRVSERRETIAFGQDYAVGHYFDIGFGVPEGDNPLIAKPRNLEPVDEEPRTA